MRRHAPRLFPLLLAVIAACSPPPAREAADLVLRNGKIVTMEEGTPQVAALAARGEHIVALGSDAEIAPWIGPETRVLDLEGRLAVPGLIEGHGHFMRYGQSLAELDLRRPLGGTEGGKHGPHTWDEIVALVAEAVATAEPGEWIVGRGWHQDKWSEPPSPNIEGLPLHHELSAVSPDNPVYLGHTSGHGAFVNAAALAAAGIGRETSDPPGGEIVRDAGGEPIGMLREDATAPVEDALARYRAARPPEVIEAELREQARRASEAAIQNGITSFQDMGSSFATIDLLKKMADEGALPLRLYIAVDEPSTELEGKLADYRMVGYGGGYLTVRTIGEKVLDGALGTHGGWLLEPYTDLPRSAGFNVTPVEEIRRSAELAVEHDFQMAIQGIGDRAVRELLDLYEDVTAGADPGLSERRWRVEHAQVVHPDDLVRFPKLGVIPSIQGLFACSDGPWVIDRLGQERTKERGYLFRSMIEVGAVVTNGTDPPVENIDPIESFHCSVTRELPDGTFFFPEEGMTREQALRAYTWGNAWAAYEDDVKGTLAVGKLADITVLSRDILTVPIEEVRGTEVVYTIIGGRVRWER